MQITAAEARQAIPWAVLAKMIGITIGMTMAALFAVYSTFGVYTVQPVDTLPDGATLVVWRASDEPFFNSPDKRCLQLVGEVTAICRGLALDVAPTGRTLLRLPYQRWAYLMSTDGRIYVE